MQLLCEVVRPREWWMADGRARDKKTDEIIYFFLPVRLGVRVRAGVMCTRIFPRTYTKGEIQDKQVCDERR